jgi:hypothetical protein
MKKFFTLAFLVLYGVINGFGQTGIQGGGFESWKYVTAYQTYDPDSSYFSTLNVLIPVGCRISAYRCDTVVGGNYSARLVTRSFPWGVGFIIIPGVIGTIKVNMAAIRAELGMPYPYGDSLPRIFSGNYQYYPANGDSGSAVLLLSKWNSSLHKRDTIAYCSQTFTGSASSWTPFEMNLDYLIPSTKPDSMTVLLLSSAGFNINNMLACQGQDGSEALFDNISLTGVNGIPLLLMPAVNVKLSPNPASGNMNIDLGSPVSGAVFEVFENQGRFLRGFPVNGNRTQVSVGDLSPGMYYYKLIKEGRLLNSGTFIVTK